MVRNKNIALLAVSVVAIAAMVSFGLTGIMSSHVADAQQVTAGDGTLVKVASVSDASQMVGWQARSPDPALAPAKAQFEVDVMKLRMASQGQNSRPVGQTWTLPDGSWIRLVQVPGLKAPNTGDTITIGSIQGEKLYYAASGNIPARVSLYWQQGNIGFCLSGTLTNSVTEETLLAMANSLVAQ